VKNEDDYGVCVCVRPPEHPPQNNSKQSGEANIYVFRYNFACRLPI
jgi:hypothetical protein